MGAEVEGVGGAGEEGVGAEVAAGGEVGVLGVELGVEGAAESRVGVAVREAALF